MRFDQTQIEWGDSLPTDDRAVFRDASRLVWSCFDSRLVPFQTATEGKAVTVLWARRRPPGPLLLPEFPDRDLNVVQINWAFDAEAWTAADKQTQLGDLLAVHESALIRLAEARGWEPGPVRAAAASVREHGWFATVELSAKQNRFARTVRAEARGVIDGAGPRVILEVFDGQAILATQQAAVHGDWHDLRAALGKVVWVDRGTVELRPRVRAGIDLGPRLTLDVPRT